MRPPTSLYRLLCLLTTLISMMALTFPAAATSADPFAAALDDKMPGWLSYYDVPGAVVSYIEDGAVVWTRAYGVKDATTQAPMTPDAIFNHGSNGKTLTAWGVMHLVEEGRIDLDAPVEKYLKRWHFPPSEFDANEVTIRRLLSHTAGLGIHGYPQYDLRRPLPTLEQVLSGQNQDQPPLEILWPPGSRVEYSGGGFALLQMVIEDVTGEPYERYMQREIMQPLGITQGGWTWTPVLRAMAATPHGFHLDPYRYKNLAVQSIGSFNSSVSDFARFLAANMSGPNGELPGRGVLTPETIARMMTPQPNTNGTTGLAFGTGRLGGSTRIVSHSGHNFGWFALFVLAPDARNGFVVAANADSADPLNYSVLKLWAESAMDSYAGLPPSLLNRIEVGPDPFAVGSVIIGAILMVSSGLIIWRMMRRVQSGLRRFQPKLSARALALALPGILVVGFWWYLFHSELPLPLATTFPECYWPREIGMISIGLALWAALGMIVALFPKVIRSETDRTAIKERRSQPVSVTASHHI